MNESEIIRAYMSQIGKKGGKATGDRKRRTPEQYKKIALAMTEGRKRAREARNRAQECNPE